MGDHFQTIVDLDARAGEAPEFAARVVEWLVAEGIVLAERTDCVLGRPLGHPPGPNWRRAVGENPDLDPSDGLAVHTRRTAFDAGQGGPESVTCPRCGVTTELAGEDYEDDEDSADYEDEDEDEDAAGADDRSESDEGTADGVWDRFAAAIEVWHATGAATVACPACAHPVPLADWTWNDDCFAFGHLGFEFWNWPEFTPGFRADIARILDGHRTAYVWGKF
ncbi:hypothetical protein ACFYS7_20635 [Streptomyces avermitilis]|uniref:hypothetical protein n=1 Tax=Streptomyces avermitilis TaxID=33903 RepID=UPI003692A298